MDPLYAGVDVGSRNNVAYLMRPDGSKYGSFSLGAGLGLMLPFPLVTTLLGYFFHKFSLIAFLTSPH